MTPWSVKATAVAPILGGCAGRSAVDPAGAVEQRVLRVDVQMDELTHERLRAAGHANVYPERRGATLVSVAFERSSDRMQLEPYLFFHGRCEEALNFYKECLARRDRRTSIVSRALRWRADVAPDYQR